jgi:hypothetical protein
MDIKHPQLTELSFIKNCYFFCILLLYNNDLSIGHIEDQDKVFALPLNKLILCYKLATLLKRYHRALQKKNYKLA